MNKKIKFTLVLTLIATVMAVMCACGTGTLEDHFKDNPDKVKKLEDNMGAMLGSMGTASIDAKGNTFNIIMKFKQTYSKEQLDSMKSAIADTMEGEGMKSQMSGNVADLEKETKIDGITCHLEYKNGDGTLIYEVDYTSKDK